MLAPDVMFRLGQRAAGLVGPAEGLAIRSLADAMMCEEACLLFAGAHVRGAMSAIVIDNATVGAVMVLGA